MDIVAVQSIIKAINEEMAELYRSIEDDLKELGLQEVQEMKIVPKLRFSDEWAQKILGELLEFKNAINADKEAYRKGVKFINVLDILSNNYITAEKIVGRVDIDKDILQKYGVNFGDVVLQRSSEKGKK